MGEKERRLLMQAKASTCLHVKAREKMEGKNQKM